MKNMTTKEFCREHHACSEGTRFALRYDTMRDCYAALLAGEAGKDSAEWAIWAATRPGVMSDRDLRLFAVRCARRVQHLMLDKRSVAALDVSEHYANGEATAEELNVARFAALAVIDAARAAAAWAAWGAAAAWAAWGAALAARAAADAAWGAAMVAADADAAWGAAMVAAAAAAANAGDVAWDATLAAERKAQLDILASFGNPFDEVRE